MKEGQNAPLYLVSERGRGMHTPFITPWYAHALYLALLSERSFTKLERFSASWSRVDGYLFRRQIGLQHVAQKFETFLFLFSIIFFPIFWHHRKLRNELGNRWPAGLKVSFWPTSELVLIDSEKRKILYTSSISYYINMSLSINLYKYFKSKE